MPGSRVCTFFYGSYMHPEVLRDIGVELAEIETASLRGYDIRIGPIANLHRDERARVYGIVGDAKHLDLERLYAHAAENLGGVYLPWPVIVTTASAAQRAALCYIAPDLPSGAASPAYVERILDAAREYNFPDEYVARLAALHPNRGRR